MSKQITLGSLFDGIGGFPYAASFYGIKAVWASEILPCAISVTRRHFSDMIHAGDLTKLSGELLPPVDIISFGSPCQDLSVAKGHRDGLSGERSGLFTEAIRIIKEMRKSTNGKYPRFAVWENVPGALHSRHGSDYKTVLEAFTDCEISMPPSGRWAKAGMVRGRSVDLAWCVYNAAEFGLAQRRKRVFLVADFGGTSAGKILFIPKGLPRHFAAGGAQGESIAAAIAGGADSANQPDIGFDGYNAALTGEQSATLGINCGMSTGRNGVLQANCLNPWDTQQKRVYTEDGTAPTLTGADGGGGRNPAGLVMTEAFGETGRGYWQPGVQTIRATGENHPGSPSHVVAAFIGRASPGAGSIGYSETEAPTLRAGIIPDVCEPKKENCGINGNIAGTLDAHYGKGPGMRGGIEREVVLCAATGQSNTEIQENLSPTLNCNCEQPIVYKPDIEILNDQGGDSLCVEKSGHAPTLRHSTHGNLPVICVASTQTDASVNDNLCPTITAAAGMSGNNKPYVVHPDKSGTLTASGAGLNRPGGQGSETDLCVAYCLQGNMIGRTDENGPQGGGVNEEISFTLNATDRPAVAAVDCRNVTESETQSGTLQAKPNGGYSLNCTPSVRIGYTVRRLTPLECERLQGFPDGWTENGISPEDYERYKKSIKRGIQRTGLPEDVVLQKISDSKRYQMLGNSVAIPCVAHIMRGIAEEIRQEEAV